MKEIKVIQKKAKSTRRHPQNTKRDLGFTRIEAPRNRREIQFARYHQKRK